MGYSRIYAVGMLRARMGEQVKLAEIADVFSGRPPQRVVEGEATANVPVLSMRDVGQRITPLEDLDLTPVGGEPDPTRRLQAGDVVVTSRGRVRAAVAGEEHAGMLVGPNLMIVRLRDSMPPALLAAYLRHPIVEARLLEDISGTGTPGFSMDTLRSLPLRRVSSDRAVALAALVEETDQYRQEVEAGARQLGEATAETVFAHLDPADEA